MHATFKSLPEDPTELRAVSELMAAEIKLQAYQIEKLKKELAAHRKARFGSKPEDHGYDTFVQAQLVMMILVRTLKSTSVRSGTVIGWSDTGG